MARAESLSAGRTRPSGGSSGEGRPFRANPAGRSGLVGLSRAGRPEVLDVGARSREASGDRRDVAEARRGSGEGGAARRALGAARRPAMKLPNGLSRVGDSLRHSRNAARISRSARAEKGATAAALFTRNRFPAAPVSLSRAALARMRRTGAGGGRELGLRERDDGTGRRSAARPGAPPGRRALRLPAGRDLSGVDGRHRRRACRTRACGRAAGRDRAAFAVGGLEAASLAILTTDAGPKVAAATFRARGTGAGASSGSPRAPE